MGLMFAIIPPMLAEEQFINILINAYDNRKNKCYDANMKPHEKQPFNHIYLEDKYIKILLKIS